MLLIGLEIANAKRRFGLVPCRVDHILAVRRQDRPHRASLRIRDPRRFAGVAVKALDLPQRKLHVVTKCTRPQRRVYKLAVRRSDEAHRVCPGRGGSWLSRCRLRRSRRADRDARSAVLVIHKRIKGAERLVGFRDDDVIAVLGPVWRDKGRLGVLRDRLRIGAVRFAYPDIFAAAAVA